MAYLLDANVFIESKNRYYGMDICPGFWEWLAEANQAGKVFSIEKVGDELIAGNDALATWATGQGKAFFLPPDQQLLGGLKQVSEWVQRQKYHPSAVGSFLQDADYYLVGHALAHGHTIVTNEIVSTSEKKVKIPNVCIGLGVKCMTPFEMLRVERVRFGLVHGGTA